MAYGSILSRVSGFAVSTTDGIHQEIKNNLITRWVLKWLGIPHIGLRLRANTILRFLEPKNTDVILDAGCGSGLYLLTLAHKIHQGFGVDIDDLKIKEATRLAKELHANNIIFKESDATCLDFPDTFFDKVICSEVLEHVKDDQKLIREFFRMLKNEGLLVISTTSLLRINRVYQEKFHHQRIGYSIEQLKVLFRNNGFSIEEISPYGRFFGQISWEINRNFLTNSYLNALTFYPLLFIAAIDKLLSHNLNGNCIGYIIQLRKVKIR